MSFSAKRRLEIVRKLYFFWGNSCILCGGKFTVCNPCTIEHIRPKSLGGTNDINNLALAHVLCNSMRGNASFTMAALAIDTWKGTPGYRKRLARMLEPKKVEAQIISLRIKLNGLKRETT